jgi:predicted kinase
MEQNKLVTLVRGLPGSGKTTLSKLLERPGTIHIENDMFHMIDGKYTFKYEVVKDAYMWIKGTVCYHLNQGDSVVVSNTFISNKTIKEYVDIAKQYNADVKIIEMKEHYGNVHNVPEDVLKSMAENWQELDKDNIKYLS